MEQTVELMLKDHIVDKEVLLMRKHDLIGLNREQAMLILNIISLEKTGNKVTPTTIQRTFNYSKSEYEHIIADLMEHGLVKVKMKKEGIEFDFKDL
jgi:predicted transcriptional regulator